MAVAVAVGWLLQDLDAMESVEDDTLSASRVFAVRFPLWSRRLEWSNSLICSFSLSTYDLNC